MNLEQLEDKWEQVKGQIKEKWVKLTDQDLNSIHGKKDKLLAKIEERYGYGKEEADRRLTTFMKDCSCEGSEKTNGIKPAAKSDRNKSDHQTRV